MTLAEPGSFEEAAVLDAINRVGDVTREQVTQIQADMAKKRTDPSHKAEFAAYQEYLDVDMAILMAIHDDILEHHQAGDQEQVIVSATRLVQYTMSLTKDKKRVGQLVMRLARMLYNELVDKNGGDRALMMERVKKGDGDALSAMFAPDLMTGFKLEGE